MRWRRDDGYIWEEQRARRGVDDVARNPAARHDPLERVAAGTLYVVLSVVLFVAWLWVGVGMLLLLALPTAVAGLVALAVGWPRLRRDLAEERARRTPSPPRPTGR
jgi:UPF0716 family protein affecting phage T7 exclusion